MEPQSNHQSDGKYPLPHLSLTPFSYSPCLSIFPGQRLLQPHLRAGRVKLRVSNWGASLFLVLQAPKRKTRTLQHAPFSWGIFVPHEHCTAFPLRSLDLKAGAALQHTGSIIWLIMKPSVSSFFWPMLCAAKAPLSCWPTVCLICEYLQPAHKFNQPSLWELLPQSHRIQGRRYKEWAVMKSWPSASITNVAKADSIDARCIDAKCTSSVY